MYYGNTLYTRGLTIPGSDVLQNPQLVVNLQNQITQQLMDQFQQSGQSPQNFMKSFIVPQMQSYGLINQADIPGVSSIIDAFSNPNVLDTNLIQNTLNQMTAQNASPFAKLIGTTAANIASTRAYPSGEPIYRFFGTLIGGLAGIITFNTLFPTFPMLSFIGNIIGSVAGGVSSSLTYIAFGNNPIFH